MKQRSRLNLGNYPEHILNIVDIINLPSQSTTHNDSRCDKIARGRFFHFRFLSISDTYRTCLYILGHLANFLFLSFSMITFSCGTFILYRPSYCVGLSWFLYARSLGMRVSFIFYTLSTAHRNARIAGAVLAIAIPSVCPSVCPSVRLPHAGIVSKRLHVARCSLHCQITKCV